MRLSELLRDVNVTEWGCDPREDILQISSDSRSLLRGGMFICIRGSKADGHDYIPDAIDRGASVIVGSDRSKIPIGTPFVLTANTRLAEAHIWNSWYGNPAGGMQVVAVTGTNGKTSTAFALREIFKCDGRHVGLVSTVRIMAGDDVICSDGGSSLSDASAAMTTPDPEYLYGAIYLMKQRDVDTLVLELSSHALDQFKADPIGVNVGVFTNLTGEHLDYHGDMESYFAAKARLAEMSEKIVVNADDPYMARLGTAYRAKAVTCSALSPLGANVSADVTALRQTSLGLSGCEFIYFSTDAVFKITSPVWGRFSVYNSMLAGAAAISAGVPPERVRDGIFALKSVDGRLERVDIGTAPFEVFIDYAHTPSALENLLSTVRGVRRRGQRITVVFGCGGDRDRTKRRHMGAVASRLADFVIVTGDNCRSEPVGEILNDILPGIDKEKPHAVIPDRREAIEYAVREASEGEIILLVGKGHEKYEITSDGKVPFDEAEIVRNAVLKYRKSNG